MVSISQIREVRNKIKKIKTISSSLKGAKEEFIEEFKKLGSEFEKASEELDAFLDMLKKRE